MQIFHTWKHFKYRISTKCPCGKKGAYVLVFLWRQFLGLRNLQGSTDHTLRNTALCDITSSMGKEAKDMKPKNLEMKMATNQL